MTDTELFEEVSKRFNLKSKTLVDQNGRYGTQLVVSGLNGNDEYCFTSLHRNTVEECISDVLDWLCTKVDIKDSPDKRCGQICMASSRQELELKLALMQ